MKYTTNDSAYIIDTEFDTDLIIITKATQTHTFIDGEDAARIHVIFDKVEDIGGFDDTINAILSTKKGYLVL